MKGLGFYKYRRHITYSLIFALIGYLAAHPITIFVYTFLYSYERETVQSQLNLSRQIAESTYKPMMLPMGVAFLFAGGFVGLLLGIAADRRRRLRDQERRRKVALETLHELMVTLSHYLLNANAVIGGMVRRTKRIESRREVLNSLSVIEEQAKKIDAVILSLQKITELKTCNYTAQGKMLMIDVANEIEEELRKAEEGQKDSRPRN